MREMSRKICGDEGVGEMAEKGSEKRLSVRISLDEFRMILREVFGVRLMTTEDLRRFLREKGIKVEKPIQRDFVEVEALRVYLPELKKEIDQTVERGERPRLLVKLTRRQKTGEPEIELVFLGGVKNRHIEELTYYKTDPMSWPSWGIIVLKLIQGRKLSAVLQKMSKKQTVDSVGS